MEARIEGLAEKAVARLFLQDSSGMTLAEALSSEGLPLRVDRAVEPGPYAVLLQAGGGGVSYALESTLEQASTPSQEPRPSDADPLHDRATGRLVEPQPECLARVEAQDYLHQVRLAIARQWQLPLDSARDQTVVLRLRIAESGRLLEVTASAGAESPIAASALEAVNRAAPFPPMSSDARCLDGT